MPSSHLVLNCVAGLHAATVCFAGCREFGGRSSRENNGSRHFGWIYLESRVLWFFWILGTSVWNRLPSLLNRDAYLVVGLNGHLGRMAGQGNVRPDFTFFFFCKSYLSFQILVKDTVVSLDWSGAAPWASIEQS